ncbi:MAG: Magnesium and cobalt efflux protein CorC [Syntrophorhabdus sp. PtaU1.Bin002]|nr:MAG: Magnesium and cobalt efflux protein CorC [Syntrophorhabdus sp. PtaB.Bin006]OPY72675.1 MAG: Magnesium and cobalt efflux protein CorC [Syntrophorhabdus sp. PtaU1.Bin002]
MNNLVWEIILIAVLLVFNGIFSAGEIAIVSSRKSKIRELVRQKKERKAESLLEMKENPERFLSAVQIGITLFGTLASALGGVLSVEYIEPWIRRVPILQHYADTIALTLVVAVLTYLFLVIGELVPKYIGMNYKEKIALRVVPLFEITSKVFSIVLNLLTFSTMFVVKGLNLKKGEEHVGEGEIKILLEEGRRKGVFDRTEEELIHGVFEFADRSVKEIMVPKPNIYAINIEDSRDKVLEYIIDNEFSRYPVYKDYPDNIAGIVYHKDITRQIWLKEAFNLSALLKKPYFVPDTMEISLLLKEMQKSRSHMAIVVDEYGATVGLVTLEDIMEEIFGEIMDETDKDDSIERLKDGSVIIDGSYSIRDINNKLQLNLEESPDYETLGGYILTQLQGIARGGEIIYSGPYRFTVVGIEGRRISKVKLEKTRAGLKKI